MIRILFKQLLDDKTFKERRRITIGEVSERSGVSRGTITRILNTAGYNTNTDTIDSLCRYFECQPGDLLQFVDEEK